MNHNVRFRHLFYILIVFLQVLAPQSVLANNPCPTEVWEWDGKMCKVEFLWITYVFDPEEYILKTAGGIELYLPPQEIDQNTVAIPLDAPGTGYVGLLITTAGTIYAMHQNGILEEIENISIPVGYELDFLKAYLMAVQVTSLAMTTHPNGGISVTIGGVTFSYRQIGDGRCRGELSGSTTNHAFDPERDFTEAPCRDVISTFYKIFTEFIKWVGTPLYGKDAEFVREIWRVLQSTVSVTDQATRHLFAGVSKMIQNITR